jgi:CheY-like chemotaxis protein
MNVFTLYFGASHAGEFVEPVSTGIGREKPLAFNGLLLYVDYEPDRPRHCLRNETLEAGMTLNWPSAKSPLKVVHLEDDALDAELIENDIVERGIPCSITRVCTREAFEAALKIGGVDLILSDSNLPGFDTLEALDTARQQHPPLPFVFLTGNISPTFRTDALARGALDVVSKDRLGDLAQVLAKFSDANAQPISHPPPGVGEPVIARCREFRCLAYLDRKGTWRDFIRNEELPDVLDWEYV